jgi:hypothetical protein
VQRGTFLRVEIKNSIFVTFTFSTQTLGDKLEFYFDSEKLIKEFFFSKSLKCLTIALSVLSTYLPTAFEFELNEIISKLLME